MTEIELANGYVVGVLSDSGVERFVGVDINPTAATVTERDRPGL